MIKGVIFDVGGVLLRAHDQSARVYQVALERLEISPPEAIFVDDFIENVEAARRLGMQAVHFVDPDQARDQLEKWLSR